MFTTDPNNEIHPEEQLGAYALDVLSDVESTLVESHLETCLQCQESVARLHATTDLLGHSVSQLSPPQSLQARVMLALPRTSPQNSSQDRAAARPRGSGWLVKTLVPLAAVIILGLFSYNLLLSYRLSMQVDELQRETATLTRMESMTAQGAQVMDQLNQLRSAGDWLAASTSRDVILEPPDQSGRSGGILLVNEDGRRAMVMVAGMRELETPYSYDIWLVRDGHDPMWAGQLKVDAKGAGAVTTHYLPQPVFDFDLVRLYADPSASDDTDKRDMVLEGRILAQKISR